MMAHRLRTISHPNAVVVINGTAVAIGPQLTLMLWSEFRVRECCRHCRPVWLLLLLLLVLSQPRSHQTRHPNVIVTGMGWPLTTSRGRILSAGIVVVVVLHCVVVVIPDNSNQRNSLKRKDVHVQSRATSICTTRHFNITTTITCVLQRK